MPVTNFVVRTGSVMTKMRNASPDRLEEERLLRGDDSGVPSCHAALAGRRERGDGRAFERTVGDPLPQCGNLRVGQTLLALEGDARPRSPRCRAA